MSDSIDRDQRYDVVVIGGGAAGLSGALALSRARRSVLVIDAGSPRNAPASHAHNYLGREGVPPLELLATGRAEAADYGAEIVEGEAVAAQRLPGGGFRVVQEDGTAVEARRLLVTTGLVDELPPVPGVAERWGRDVLHCPYCHGYEICGTAIGVLIASRSEAMDQVRALSQWGQITAFHDGALSSSEAEELSLQLRGIGATLEKEALVGMTGKASLTLADGSSREVEALFVHPETTLASGLAKCLGCATEDAGCITTDSAKQSTIPGVFACGDAARFAGNIALAVGEGALAGVAAHRSLLGLLP